MEIIIASSRVCAGHGQLTMLCNRTRVFPDNWPAQGEVKRKERSYVMIEQRISDSDQHHQAG